MQSDNGEGNMGTRKRDGENTVGTKVEELRENFGKMLSGFAGFARSSSHAQSVDFQDAEKLRERSSCRRLRKPNRKRRRELRQKKYHQQLIKRTTMATISAKTIPRHTTLVEKEKTTTGLFGGFFFLLVKVNHRWIDR